MVRACMSKMMKFGGHGKIRGGEKKRCGQAKLRQPGDRPGGEDGAYLY